MSEFVSLYHVYEKGALPDQTERQKHINKYRHLALEVAFLLVFFVKLRVDYFEEKRK